MVEIREDILEKLKCDVCDGYLSASPVLLKTTGENICQYCSETVKNDRTVLAIRNETYENLASMMLFPCRYKFEGCPEVFPWNEVKFHEEDCEFKMYDCAVAEIENCSWSGTRLEMMEHFKNAHPDQISEHPCKPILVVTESYSQCFLMTVFGFLFLVQIQICKSISKVWHSVRYYGSSKHAPFFEFRVEIGNDEECTTKKKLVNCDKTATLCKENVIEFAISEHLRLMQKYRPAKIMIKVDIKNKKCVKCNDDLIDQIYLSNDGCVCEKCKTEINDVSLCSLTEVRCKNFTKGCFFKDIYANIMKHEFWYCEYNEGTCILQECKMYLENTSLMTHFKYKHAEYPVFSNVSYSENRPVNKECHRPLISYDTLFFRIYNFEEPLLTFKVISDLPKSDTKFFSCVLKVTNPGSGYFVQRELKCDMSSAEHDWIITIKNDFKNSLLNVLYENGNYEKTYNIELTITKIYE